MKPCPFCASKEIRVATFKIEEFSIKCLNCGASTGLWSTADSALECWTARRGEQVLELNGVANVVMQLDVIEHLAVVRKGIVPLRRGQAGDMVKVMDVLNLSYDKLKSIRKELMDFCVYARQLPDNPTRRWAEFKEGR
jgi:hypothetical protein